MGFLDSKCEKIKICPKVSVRSITTYGSGETSSPVCVTPFAPGSTCICSLPAQAPPPSVISAWQDQAGPSLKVMGVCSAGDPATSYECGPYSAEGVAEGTTCCFEVVTTSPCTYVMETRLKYDDVMAALRLSHPYADGWRVVAVLPYQKSFEELDTRLEGVGMQHGTNYKEHIAAKLGLSSGGYNSGGSEENYEYAAQDKFIAFTEFISNMHEVGDATPDTVHDQIILSGEDDDGSNLGESWEEQPDGSYNKNFGTWLEDVCIDVYLLRPEDGQEDTGITSSNDDINENTGIPVSNPTEGSYSSSIDGGVSDRSNGERFVGASYTGLRSFDNVDKVIHDSLYVPDSVDLTDPDSTYDDKKIGDVVVAGPGDFLSYNIRATSIDLNMSEPSFMVFEEYAKYDEAGVYEIGDWCYGILINAGYSPKTVFSGTIVSKKRILSEGQQFIKYEATGPIQRLADLGFAFQVGFEDKTIREVAELVTGWIPHAIVSYTSNISTLPNTTVPDIDWSTINYKRALDMLMDLSGHYGYYIDHLRILHFYDLKNLTAKTIVIPAEGAAISDSYNVLSKDLNKDVTQARTRCLAIGDYPEIETTEFIPVIAQSAVASATPPYAYMVGTNAATPEQENIWGIYIVVLSHGNIQNQLLSDDEKAIEVQASYKQYQFPGIQIMPGWRDPLSNPYNFVTKDTYAGFYIKAYKDCVNAFRVTYVYKSSVPIQADTGWMGTAYSAYGVQNTMLLSDNRFKKQISHGEVIRDDSADLLQHAKQQIQPYRDWKLGGTVVLDGIQREFEIGHCVNFSGTTEDWTAINAFIQTIVYDFVNKTTTLELTNNYYAGTGIIDPNVADKYKVIKDSEEVQRIINRLNTLEERTRSF